MRRPRVVAVTNRGARLVALRLLMGVLAAGLAACSASRDAPAPTARDAVQWAALVDKTIFDADRARRLKSLGERLGGLREAFDRDAAGLVMEAEALDADYDATREQADQVIARFTARRRAVLGEYRDVVLAMRRETSAAEWRALTD
ncbi:MAG: hypothetical protein ACK5YW_04875 [Betaproteobacteria bacterium]|nr:hypothetical protein [Rhodocyclaceae bacterium]MCA3135213.1 hypothetical protein [Rhodocyclaceae bacterium]MCA3142712.1 hypothetical protein [Rhodocyclaceae bacterium]MCA3145245.1 hypothetical protein [Rhodocyclaceae bacterium]MCE2899361.1 hypothetical protein [Betaproteobacteria bacterium]